MHGGDHRLVPRRDLTGTGTAPERYRVPDQRVAGTAPRSRDAADMTQRRLVRPLVVALALVALVGTAGWTQASNPAGQRDPGLEFAPATTQVQSNRADRPDGPDRPQALRADAATALGAVAHAAREAASRSSTVARSAAALVAIGASVAIHARDRAQALAAAAAVEAERREAADLTGAYSGRNRFWIPSLDMSYRVHLFECTRKREPDHYMYRWGCAGKNNVYILGHASSVMKPLHDLFERGDLEVGMIALYADGQGRVRAYRVTEWRVVDPVDSHWAIASQDVPSMTLQTCVGKNGVDRLNVRLVAFG